MEQTVSGCKFTDFPCDHQLLYIMSLYK